MGLPFGKFATVENTSVASKTAKDRPAFFASMAAAIPETPPPTIARSRTCGSAGGRCPLNSGSARIESTARAPESEENLSSGMPVRSPTMRTPGTAVVPSSRISGSGSTVPAGQRV